MQSAQAGGRQQPWSASPSSRLAATTTPTSFDARAVLPLLCVVSVVAFAVQLVAVRVLYLRARKAPPPALNLPQCGLAQRNGGWIALAWGVARLSGLLSLGGVQIWGILTQEGEGKVVQWAEVAAWAYLATLSLLSIVRRPSPGSDFSRSLRPSLVILLLVAFVIYVWRDAGPLVTFTRPSMDPWTGPTVAKLAILAFTSGLPPLLAPRTSVSVSSRSVPTGEETASLLSFLFFSWVDPLIYRAWKKPTSLSLEDLPQISGAEEAEYLKTTFIRYIDPADPRSKKSLLRGMIRIWWKEAILMECAGSVQVFFRFFGIIGTQQLLAYKQDPSAATIRPWVWAAALAVGPLLNSMSFNLFMTVSLKAARQVESLCLQMVYEQALRLRINEAPANELDAEGKKKKNLVGKVNSLVSNDVAAAGQIRLVIYFYTDIILSTIFCAFLLWKLLRWTAFVAMVCAVLVLPISIWAVKYQRKLQKAFKALTDARVQKVSEALLGLRITKALGLEARVKEDLDAARTEELITNRRSQYLGLVGNVITASLPNLVILATLSAFTQVQGGVLDAATIFTAITLLQRFSAAASGFFTLKQWIIGPTTAIERLDEFLRLSPLIDRHFPGELVPVEESWIGFRNASFSWYKDLPETSTMHNFRLEVEDLTFEKGKITVVTGPTGGGKTSLLMALLGEMHFEKKPGSICSLPRSEGISYHHQQSFLQALTVRDNITFGAPFDRERYDQVVVACALEQDLAMFKAGDLTEVGEKGITLSGGQKCRLSLARAIYAPSQTILIDDCFSSLDVQTSKWVVEKVFKSSLVKGRTIILVTHHISLVASTADSFVEIANGKVMMSGPFEKVVSEVPDLLARDEKDLEQEKETGAVPTEPVAIKEKDKVALVDGRLAVDEEKIDGKVGFKIVRVLISSFGDWKWWTVFLLCDIVSDLGSPARSWWFSVWARASSVEEHVNNLRYLGIFAALAFAGIFINTLTSFIWTFGTFRSGRLIHKRLLESVMRCTVRFLDTTPQGRLLSRFTKDIRAVDTSLSIGTKAVVTTPLLIMTQLCTILYLVPWFSPAAFLVATVGAFVANLYLNAQRSVKRENSNRQGPVFGHFAEAMAGVVSIRAFGAEQAFREVGVTRINEYMRSFSALHALNRWSTSRFDILNCLFAGGLASYLLFVDTDRDAATVGLILSTSLSFSMYLLYVIRCYNDWEVDMVSIERIQSYINIEHEPASTPKGEPPAAWPTSGSLVVEGLSARYTKDGPKVLDDVSFSLKSGQKCAVVGRTGSGKSTLAVSLLRLIPTEGTVLIDGLDASKLNLEAIRKNVTLIPQDPTLFSGDIRKNIDPHGTTDDATLNDILRSIGLLKSLKDTQPSIHISYEGEGGTSATTPAESTRGVLSLDSHVAAGGENLSQGTRQLVSYARGLVRRSKIYIFDEATASIDHAIDAQIQTTLRSEMNDCTLLTIAHRLLSIIDYDLILCLAEGKVVEFDSPANLLEDPKGHFRALVDASSDRELLLEMVAKSKAGE